MDPTDIVGRLFAFDPTRSLEVGTNIGARNIASAVSIANANERGRSNRVQEGLSRQRIDNQSSQFNQSQALSRDRFEHQQSQDAHGNYIKQQGLEIDQANAQARQDYDRARVSELKQTIQQKDQQFRDNEMMSRVLGGGEPLNSITDFLQNGRSVNSPGLPSVGNGQSDGNGDSASSSINSGGAFSIAKNFIGQNEFSNRKEIGDFIEQHNGHACDPSKTPWCGGFVGAALKASGIDFGLSGKDALWARNFLKVGEKVDKPQPGDVAVFSRGNGGHVGFFSGFDDKGGIRVLGGNQSNGVNIKSYPASRLLGFRRFGSNPSLRSPGFGGVNGSSDNKPNNGSPSLISPGLPQVSGTFDIFKPKSGSLRSTAFGPANIDPQTALEIRNGRMAEVNGDQFVGSSGIRYRGLEDDVPTIANKSLTPKSFVRIKSDIYPDGRIFQVAGNGPSHDNKIDFFTTNRADYRKMANQKIKSVEMIGDSLPGQNSQDGSGEPITGPQPQPDFGGYETDINRMRELGYDDDYIGLKLMEPRFKTGSSRFSESYQARLNNVLANPQNRKAHEAERVAEQQRIYGNFDGKVNPYYQTHIDNLKQGIPIPESVQQGFTDPKIMKSGPDQLVPQATPIPKATPVSEPGPTPEPNQIVEAEVTPQVVEANLRERFDLPEEEPEEEPVPEPTDEINGANDYINGLR